MTLHIIGAGGHASVIVDIARCLGITELTVWYERRPDEARFPPGTRFSPSAELPRETAVFLGIGDLLERREWRTRLSAVAPALLHPSATVGYGVQVSPGLAAMAGVVVNPNCKIGVDVILNTGSIIEHDCEIGANTHIAPGARLGGGVRVGSDVLIGTGAIVLPSVNIGSGAVVGAGAVVTANLPSGLTVAGIPAKPLVGDRRD